MPFRAKCPACGRKQSLQDSDLGHTIWCAACGQKFTAEWTPPEPDAPTSAIPDIDFPINFGLTNPAPPVVSSTSISPPAPPPPTLPPPPPPLLPPTPDFIPRLSLPTPPPAFVAPEPIAPPPAKNHLVPILVTIVVVMGLGLLVGLFAVVHLVERPPIVETIVAPAPIPAITPAPASPPPLHTESTTETTTAPAETQPPIASEPTESAPVIPPPMPLAPAPVVIQQPPPPAPKFEPVPAPSAGPDLDDAIGQAIDHGVDFLLSQFSGGILRGSDARGTDGPGLDALAVYALLQAGEATHDLRLGPDSALVGQMLDRLKALSMDNEDATYSHSLRAAALGVYHRAADKQTLRADAAWLISSSMHGAYTYGVPPRVSHQNLSSRFQFFDAWDNSNSQYGALGVWAALEAGVEIPNSYWTAVDRHWLGCQLPDGEWGYRGYGDMGRMSMTVAGITTLFVAEDQLDQHAVVATLGHAPFSASLLHGLNWLEAGDNSVRLPGNGYQTYAMFGLERAALASGFKYFGTHDWYRELANTQLTAEMPDGSWNQGDSIVDTAYTLLFLSRGRHPIFMNKLRFDGFWANRPRDIANLTHFAASQLERPLNWQVVSLKSSWSDWMDAPVLYIASHEPLKFTDADCDKLRSFAENGGLIFTHADGDSPAFNRSIVELSKRLFPQYPLADLPPTHPIFSTLYKIKLQPRLQGISNNSRLLLVHSPTDINKPWQLRDWVDRPTDFQMGMDIFIYAAGKANLRNKLKTPLVADFDVNPILTSSIAQLKYPGNFNPEPAGLPRFAKLFLKDTSVKLNVLEMDPSELDPQKVILAHLTGTGAVVYGTPQLHAIHDYVANGGILLVDACGASPAFIKSMLLDFWPHAFPESQPRDMPPDDPILKGAGAGMTPVVLHVRPYRIEQDGTTTLPIQFFTLGKGMVIFSPIDLTTGFLGTSTWGVNGYEPETVYNLVRNVILEKLEN